MKIRNTPRVFDVINDTGYKNLLVGGCSFTYNISDADSSSWPYYLRDKCGFDQVYDCSIEGASNYQIFSSIIYALETTDLDPTETLVIIMWSGYNRESKIVSAGCVGNKKYAYNYNNQVSCINTTNYNNQLNQKSNESQALENYVHVASTWNYLKNRGYQFVFLNFVDPTIKNKNTFNIEQFLPIELKKKFTLMFADIENFFVYCVKHDYLQEDQFHPTMQGHLNWTHHVLAPALTANLNSI
jgi:hypothetical protein